MKRPESLKGVMAELTRTVGLCISGTPTQSQESPLP